MDLLLCTSRFGDPTTSYMPLLATELSERGHTVYGTQYRPGSDLDGIRVDSISVPHIKTPWWAGQWLLNQMLPGKLETKVAELDPDAMVVGASNIVPGISAAKTHDVPAVVVIPGLGFTRYNPLDLAENKSPRFRSLPSSAKIQYPFIKSLHTEYTEHLQQASEVIVISEFLQRCLHQTFAVESQVVRTPRLLDSFIANKHSPEYILMVNPRHRLKGADVFVKIARQLPEHEFAIAGDLPNDEIQAEAESLDNIRLFGWVDDMKSVYAKTKLLLAPSRYQEGGGPAAVIEGFANGIPAVGTDRGAIPEHIQTGGEVVTNIDNINEWVEMINTVLSDYETYADEAKQISTEFKSNQQVDEFEAIIKDTVQSSK